VVATEPAGNTAVKTYPDVQQLFNNWCSGGGWGNCFNDTPISGLAQLTSTYAETTPRGGTIAQFAWDIWTSNNSGHPNEIGVGRQLAAWFGGATQVGTAIAGQAWTIYKYRSASSSESPHQAHSPNRAAGQLISWRSEGVDCSWAHVSQRGHRTDRRRVGNLLDRWRAGNIPRHRLLHPVSLCRRRR
jgi:hypothetical protein